MGRGGFPGGNFGGINMNQLMKQAKKMQADIEESQKEQIGVYVKPCISFSLIYVSKVGVTNESYE